VEGEAVSRRIIPAPPYDPGPEARISALVAEHITHWRCNNPKCGDDGWIKQCGACGRHGHANCYGNGQGGLQIACYYWHMPAYSENIEAAWEIVTEHLGSAITLYGPGAPYAGEEYWNKRAGWNAEIEDHRVYDASSAAMAICLIALKKAGVEVPP
jgi:hypothetical protein